MINHDLLIIRAVQERQQELVRRKISGLQRLMQCKLFVGQVESFTERLQKHAEDLFSGIRIKQVLVAHAFLFLLFLFLFLFRLSRFPFSATFFLSFSENVYMQSYSHS